MLNLFSAFGRLTTAINNIASTLEAANERLTKVVGYEQPPMDLVPELPAPEAETNGNGESRRKAKARS